MNEVTTQPEAKTDTPVSDPAESPTPATDAPAGTESETTTSQARGDRPARRGSGDRRDNRRGGGQQRRGRRGGGRREERAKPEFDQKIVSLRRVTRVMAGGRRFSFSVAMVLGDKKGRVGVGVGKAGDTQLAIEKAARDARKHMITIPMNTEGRIPHDVHTKYASSEVMIMPAPGRGLVAGSSVRTVLELGGVKDVTAKLFSRSKNKLNNAQAAIAALKQLEA